MNFATPCSGDSLFDAPIRHDRRKLPLAHRGGAGLNGVQPARHPLGFFSYSIYLAAPVGSRCRGARLARSRQPVRPPLARHRSHAASPASSTGCCTRSAAASPARSPCASAPSTRPQRRRSKWRADRPARRACGSERGLPCEGESLLPSRVPRMSANAQERTCGKIYELLHPGAANVTRDVIARRFALSVASITVLYGTVAPARSISDRDAADGVSSTTRHALPAGATSLIKRVTSSGLPLTRRMTSCDGAAHCSIAGGESKIILHLLE